MAMATRTITTSQPDVACDVCERRLLRGEQHDIFLAAGHQRVVCELCAPRAVQEGWRRESDGEAVTLAPPRPRRGRNLFARLRQSRAERTRSPSGDDQPVYVEEPPLPALDGAHEAGHSHFSGEAAPQNGDAPVPGGELPDYADEGDPAAPESHPYDFLGGLEIVEGRPVQTGEVSLSDAARGGAGELSALAIEIFNSSEFPRRIAGIARSLGAPLVNVSRVEDTVGDTVAIVVGWELCWYRYEVDLDEQAPVARLKAQGTELDELPRGERVGNTPIDELGLLASAA
jgi:hypothetical protein